MRGEVLFAKKVPFALQEGEPGQWRAIVSPVNQREPTTLPYANGIAEATAAAQAWVKVNVGREFTI